MSYIFVHRRDIVVIAHVSFVMKVEKCSCFFFWLTRAVKKGEKLKMICVNPFREFSLAAKFFLTLKWIREQNFPQLTILLGQFLPILCDEFLLQSINSDESFISASNCSFVNLSKKFTYFGLDKGQRVFKLLI